MSGTHYMPTISLQTLGLSWFLLALIKNQSKPNQQRNSRESLSVRQACAVRNEDSRNGNWFRSWRTACREKTARGLTRKRLWDKIVFTTLFLSTVGSKKQSPDPILPKGPVIVIELVVQSLAALASDKQRLWFCFDFFVSHNNREDLTAQEFSVEKWCKKL